LAVLRAKEKEKVRRVKRVEIQEEGSKQICGLYKK